MQWLDSTLFKQAEAELVLACVDSIVCDEDGNVLLGYRLNPPVLGWWLFGGRMAVGESYQDTAKRQLQKELNVTDFTWRGIVGHYLLDYPALNYEKKCTHHMVVPKIVIDSKALSIPEPNNEHSRFQWFSRDQLLSKSDSFHPYLRDALTDAGLL